MLKNNLFSPPSLSTDTALILLPLLVLVSFGIVVIASASIAYSEYATGDPYYFTKRHAVYLLLGMSLGLFVYCLPTQTIDRLHPWLMVFSFALLLMTLVPGIGHKVNGSRRWLMFGPLTLQVSELVKFSILCFLASFLSRRSGELVEKTGQFFKPLAIVSVYVLLVLLEPDFGGAVVLASLVVFLLFLGGARIFPIVLLGVGGSVISAALILGESYRYKRLISYLDPWKDQFNSGYQLTQSLIAYGQGKVTGVGLGNSVQKLFYLPEAHTDFVVSIWAEEMGYIGLLVLIFTTLALVSAIANIAIKAVKNQRLFAGYFCFGAAFLLGIQAFVNIGVSCGLLPTKGLTYPFVSYGGSSLLLWCTLMAVILRVASDQTDSCPLHTAPKSKTNSKRSNKGLAYG